MQSNQSRAHNEAHKKQFNVNYYETILLITMLNKSQPIKFTTEEVKENGWKCRYSVLSRKAKCKM